MRTVKVRCFVLLLSLSSEDCQGWFVPNKSRSPNFLRSDNLQLSSVVDHAVVSSIDNQHLYSDTDHALGISSWLVCGDGDLSYSAVFAQDLFESQSKVIFTGTVLEDQETHHDVYANSRAHVDTILASNASVAFSIDATRLKHHFPNQQFDRITFNFPHWRGKANNRYNRELLSSFFKSTESVLSPGHGQVHVALCQGQGGSTVTTVRDWKGSWMAAMYAAEHGLMLQSIEPYQPRHTLSAHRGVDRAFHIGNEPKLYRFGFPNGSSVPRHLQLYCRHELHIVLQDDEKMPDGMKRKDIIEGDAIKNFIQDHNILPDGVAVDVPLREILTMKDGTTLAICGIVYRGEGIPMTRALADSCRATLEEKMVLPLRANRLGRPVSKPFPYPIMRSLLGEEHL